MPLGFQGLEVLSLTPERCDGIICHVRGPAEVGFKDIGLLEQWMEWVWRYVGWSG